MSDNKSNFDLKRKKNIPQVYLIRASLLRAAFIRIDRTYLNKSTVSNVKAVIHIDDSSMAMYMVNKLQILFQFIMYALSEQNTLICCLTSLCLYLMLMMMVMLSTAGVMLRVGSPCSVHIH